jgi:site-specific recombinase XerD
MAQLLYGSGLRLMECVRLKSKNIDCGQYQIVVRSGKGMKDRSTVLSDQLRLLLSEQIDRVKNLQPATTYGRSRNCWNIMTFQLP